MEDGNQRVRWRDTSNNSLIKFCIADDVAGFEELWVIGETTFMHKAIKYLRPLINSGRRTESPPYFTSRYDIFWEIDYEAKNFWSQIRNSLVKLMNARWKLPNYIIIIFSNKCVNDTLHYAQHLYIPMNALGDFISRVIFERTSELPTRSIRSTDPQVVVIRTVSKSDKFQELNNFKNKRRTFNKALQRMGERSSFRTVNIDEVTPQKQLFDDNGDLSPNGFNTFWNCINIDIRNNDTKRLKAFEEQNGPVQVRPVERPQKDIRNERRQTEYGRTTQHPTSRYNSDSSEEGHRHRYRSQHRHTRGQPVRNNSDYYW